MASALSATMIAITTPMATAEASAHQPSRSGQRGPRARFTAMPPATGRITISPMLTSMEATGTAISAPA